MNCYERDKKLYITGNHQSSYKIHITTLNKNEKTKLHKYSNKQKDQHSQILKVISQELIQGNCQMLAKK